MTKLEEFVARLHADGVEAGRAEAERLVREAQLRADTLLAEAEARAEATVAEAQARADALVAQREADLRLAVRDAVLQLRSALTTSLETLLRRETEAALADPTVVTELLKTVVSQYAGADARAVRRIAFDVPPELRDQVATALLAELGASAAGKSVRVDVQGELAEAGFEYRVGDGGTVEVTTEAVLEVLKGLVRPALHQLLNGVGPAGPE